MSDNGLGHTQWEYDMQVNESRVGTVCDCCGMDILVGDEYFKAYNGENFCLDCVTKEVFEPDEEF